MKIALRPDGTAVIMDADIGPYHVASKQDDPHGKYDLYEILQYAKDHPDDVVDEPLPKVPEMSELDRLALYLTNTDWYAIRQAETGKPIPEDVLKARQEARDKISKLRGDTE